MHIEILVGAAPDAELLARLMRQAAADLGRDHQALLCCRLRLERTSGEDAWEARAELLFPGRQIIVNRSGILPRVALRAALAAAGALAAHQQHRDGRAAYDALGVAA